MVSRVLGAVWSSPRTRSSRLHWTHVEARDLTGALIDGAAIVALFWLWWLSIRGACKCVNFVLTMDH